MNFREATTKDIPQLHAIRMAVKENVLNNPLLVTEADYINFLTQNGKGWLCEADGEVAGFAIINTSQNNIWALFVKPGSEKKGIGKQLHDIMLHWFFDRYENTVWLGTAPDTRAEHFYRAAGWKEVARMDNGEIKFEMAFNDWKKHRLVKQ